MAKATKKTTPPKSNGKPVSEADPNLAAFFADELKDIYWAEKQLVKTLPKMQKAATSPELKKAFVNHLEETKVHVTRLEQVFELLGKKAQAKNAMPWLVLQKKVLAL